MVATLPSRCHRKFCASKPAKSTRGGAKRFAVSPLCICCGVAAAAVFDIWFSPSTRECEATADAQHLAGDVVGSCAREKDDRVGDLLGLGKTLERDRADERVLE